jgi:hypothetical protein
MAAIHPNSPIGPNGTGSIVCLVLAGSRSLPLRSDPAPKPDSSSHLGLLCQFQGIVSNCTGREVFCCMTMARAATRSPWQMSRTFSLTRSQARSLLSIPRSNSARSRARRNSWSLMRIAQISFSLNGPACPCSMVPGGRDQQLHPW